MSYIQAKKSQQSLLSKDEIQDLQSSLQEEADKAPIKEYKSFKRRYFIVLLYGLNISITSFIYPLCNTISQQLSQVYSQNLTVVNLSSQLYLLMHPLFTFLASYSIQKYSIRINIMIGCFFCLLGSCLRLLVAYDFFYIIIGSVISGIGRPFILNLQGKIVATWFQPYQRALIMQILSFLNSSFIVAGMLFPGFMFKNFDQKKESNTQEGERRMKNLVLYETIITLVCTLPSILFFIEKPPSPPSFTCTVQRESPKKSITLVLKNSNFVKLWFVYGIYFGSFNALGILTTPIVYSYGITNPSDISIISSMPIVSGFVSAILVGIILKKFYKFKLILIIFILGCIISISINPLFIKDGKFYLAVISSLINGIFIVPAVPVMLELAIELTFPVSEAVPVGLLFAGGQLWGCAIAFIVQLFATGKNQKSSLVAIYTFVGLFIISFIIILFTKEDLKRLRAEKTKAISSVNINEKQWQSIKSQYGGDLYSKKD